jgi:hypothetical protein
MLQSLFLPSVFSTFEWMFSVMKRPHDVKLSRQEGEALIERLEADALSVPRLPAGGRAPGSPLTLETNPCRRRV